MAGQPLAGGWPEGTVYQARMRRPSKLDKMTQEAVRVLMPPSITNGSLDSTSSTLASMSTLLSAARVCAQNCRISSPVAIPVSFRLQEVQQVSLCIEALEKNVKDIIDTRYRESQLFLSQRLAEAVSRLQDTFTQKIDTAHSVITAHLGAQIQATQQQTIDKITEIQTQCNKTDATVSGIHTTVQQVSLRIEALERNVK